MSDQPYNRGALIRWYDEHSENYDEVAFKQTDDLYGGDSYRIELVRRILDDLKPRTVLDVGCGTARPMLTLLERGFDTRGFDLSPGMIREAKKHLADAGHSPDRAAVDDILDPGVVGRWGAASYDAVVANGVLPYIEDDETAHAHLAKLVRPGGRYVSAYSNELLDLATFNRFTLRFHIQNFIEPLPIERALKDQIIEQMRGLLTHPDKPESIPEGARDRIFVRAHNPMTVGRTLKRFNLVVEDMLFYKFHAFPPLLKDRSSDLRRTFMQQSRAYEVEHARDWRGYFIASTFIVVARHSS